MISQKYSSCNLPTTAHREEKYKYMVLTLNRRITIAKAIMDAKWHIMPKRQFELYEACGLTLKNTFL